MAMLSVNTGSITYKLIVLSNKPEKATIGAATRYPTHLVVSGTIGVQGVWGVTCGIMHACRRSHRAVGGFILASL